MVREAASQGQTSVSAYVIYISYAIFPSPGASMSYQIQPAWARHKGSFTTRMRLYDIDFFGVWAAAESQAQAQRVIVRGAAIDLGLSYVRE